MYMTEFIPEYAAEQHTETISLKFNFDASDNYMETVNEVLRYGSVCFDDTTAKLVTIGIHSDCEKPHIHINIIGNNRVQGDLKNNASRHRRRYWNDYVGHPPPSQLSCKVGAVDDVDEGSAVDSVVRCLSYPYKEGKVIKLPSYFSKAYVMLSDATTAFLKSNGQALYKQSLHNKMYKERQNARQGNILENVLEISQRVYEDKWQNWRDEIYKIYFEGIELKEIPDLGLFEKAVQKVAIYRKIVPPFFFCRA